MPAEDLLNYRLLKDGATLNKEQLIHVISAACRQLNCLEMYLLGSQAAYGSLDVLPEIALTSNEADLIPKKHPERAIEISGGMGEFTLFHKEFDYYAHGLEFSEVALPEDWKDNLVDISYDEIKKAISKIPDHKDGMKSRAERNLKLIKRTMQQKPPGKTQSPGMEI